MKQAAFFLILFLTTILSSFGQAVSLKDSTISLLRKGAEGFKDRYHSPSLVLAVIHRDEIVFSEALGYLDTERRIPASLDAVYSIQSLTKVFTATMFMQLMQRGQVGLQYDVTRYVPEFMSSRKETNGTTLFQLATHTAGLPRNSAADIHFTKQIDRWMLGGQADNVIEAGSRKDFLRSLASVTKEYPEYQLLGYGNRRYSNLGYALLGLALERAAKTRYEEYVINQICRPLKMTESKFFPETPDSVHVAKGYFYDEKTKEFLQVPAFRPNAMSPAGGMYASARDLARFISFQLGSTGNDAVLSAKNRAMMQTLGIGWKPAYPLVLHEGAMLGYRCQMALNPELKTGWIILTNTTDFDFTRINEYLNQVLTPVFSKKPATELEALTGTYRLEGGFDSLQISLKDGKLYSGYLNDILPDRPLEPAGALRFNGPGKGGYRIIYEFVPGADRMLLNMGQLMWVKNR